MYNSDNQKRAKAVFDNYIAEIQETIKLKTGKKEGIMEIKQNFAKHINYGYNKVLKHLGGARIPLEQLHDFLEGIVTFAQIVEMDSVIALRCANQLKEIYSKVYDLQLKEDNSVSGVRHNLLNMDDSEIISRPDLNNALDGFLVNSSKNIMFIYGYRLTGKSSSLSKYAYNLVNNPEKINMIVWCKEYEEDDVTGQEKEIVQTVNAVGGIEDKVQSSLSREEAKNTCIDFLKKRNALLILDYNDISLNYNTIAFLKRISRYSKIVILSSKSFLQYEEELLGICETFSMNQGMSTKEMRELIKAKTKTDYFLDEVAEDLHEITEGIPYLALYIYKKVVHENNYGIAPKVTIQQYKEYSAKGYEALVDAIISKGWEDAPELAKKILTICIALGFSVSLEMVAFICGTEIARTDFREALEYCYDNLLLNPIKGVKPRCLMTKVIRNLLSSVIVKENRELQRVDIFHRATEYYINLTSKVGFCYNEVYKLRLLDAEDEFNVLQVVLDYCFSHGMYDEYCEIGRNVKYFIYVRGIWKTGKDSLYVKRAEVAHLLSDYNQELEAISSHINVASKQKNKQEAKKYIEVAERLLEVHRQEISEYWQKYYLHAKALFLFNCEERYEEACKIWKENLGIIGKDSILNEHDYMANMRWYQKCLFKCGKNSPEEMYKIFSEGLEEATKVNFKRAMIDYNLQMTNLQIEMYLENFSEENLEGAESCKNAVKKLLVEEQVNDKKYLADYYALDYLCGKCKKDEKVDSYQKVIEIYKELNCEKDLVSFRQKIQKIETRGGG